jgi:hypothetical protein
MISMPGSSLQRGAKIAPTQIHPIVVERAGKLVILAKLA